MTPTNAQETVQESFARHAMRKTQPPKSLVRVVTQFPPDEGVRKDEY